MLLNSWMRFKKSWMKGFSSVNHHKKEKGRVNHQRGLLHLKSQMRSCSLYLIRHQRTVWLHRLPRNRCSSVRNIILWWQRQASLKSHWQVISISTYGIFSSHLHQNEQTLLIQYFHRWIHQLLKQRLWIHQSSLQQSHLSWPSKIPTRTLRGIY